MLGGAGAGVGEFTDGIDPEKRFPYLDYYFVKVVKKEGKLGYQILDVNRDVRPD